MISFEEFQKIDLGVGKIIEAEKIEGADRLLKLKVDLGAKKDSLLLALPSFINQKI